MNLLNRMNVFALSALVALSGLHAESPKESHPSFKATNVVVLIIDGPRQSEMWADATRKNIPHLNALAPKGALMTGFRNNGPTYTDAGHTALSTGFYQEINNSGEQFPDHPGIFQCFLKATNLPSTQAWVITSKDKLAILSDTEDVNWRGKFRPSTWCGKYGKGPGAGYAEDGETVAAIKSILTEHHPRLVLINFKQPDAGGHSGNWANYINGLMASETYAADIWAFIQADPQYKDHTEFFVTHDHGRHLDGHLDGFVNHGDNCEGCRQLALLALGPDIQPGKVIPKGGEQIDVPPTVAKILGFPMPGLQGRVLKELFRNQ